MITMTFNYYTNLIISFIISGEEKAMVIRELQFQEIEQLESREL